MPMRARWPHHRKLGTSVVGHAQELQGLAIDFARVALEVVVAHEQDGLARHGQQSIGSGKRVRVERGRGPFEPESVLCGRTCRLCRPDARVAKPRVVDGQLHREVVLRHVLRV